MQPVWVSLGDYDNVLAARRFWNREPKVPHNPTLHAHPIWAQFSAEQSEEACHALCTPGSVVAFEARSSGGAGRDGGKADTQKAAQPVGSPVAVSLENSDDDLVWAGLRFSSCRAGKGGAVLDWQTDDVVKALLGDTKGYHGMSNDLPIGNAVVMFPGCHSEPSAAPPPPGGPSSYMFHRNSQGASCFTPAEAEAASAFLASSDFVGEVQRRIAATAFQIPQAKQLDMVSSFCNEDVYGKFSLMEMTGVVRL
jgi:hypothetical protein